MSTKKQYTMPPEREPTVKSRPEYSVCDKHPMYTAISATALALGCPSCKLAEAEAENDALRKWCTEHKTWCDIADMPLRPLGTNEPHKCTCKLDELLNKQEKDNV